MNCKTVLLKDLVLGEKGSYGIGAPAVDYDPKKYTYLRITDINDDGSINTNGLKSVDAEDAYKYVLQENDIVFARTGASTGKTYFYQPQDGTLVYAGFLIKFSIDPRKVNPRLLKYITHSQEYYNWVRSFDTGGTRGNINAVTFANMPITLPNRATQDKIVAILSSLDDKIELNRRINANLEQQAQTLYKSWFVDNKKDDWEEVELGDIATILAGGDKPEIYVDKQTDDCKVPIYSNGIDNEGLFGYTRCAKIYEHSITISARGTIGFVCLRTEPYVPIVRLISVIPQYNNLSAEYLYLWAITQNISGTGTTQQQLTIPYFKKTKIIIPNQELLIKFNKVISPIFITLKKNKTENNNLSNLRDTLLPKLMSGEIKA